MGRKLDPWPNLTLAVKDLRKCLRDHGLDDVFEDISEVFDNLEFEESPFRVLLSDAGAMWNIGFIRGAAEGQDCTVMELLDKYAVH